MTASHRPHDDRAWVNDAILRLEQEAARSSDTHLLRLELPGYPGIRFYFKDEAAHPTGSLKHRLARSLFLYALCNGRLHAGQTVLDASSGSTAISEAWFARQLGLPFIAVMPRCTAVAKQREIVALGGRCELVDDPRMIAAHAAALATRLGAVHLDQFGLAERATDWRGNNNIAESMLAQLAREPDPEPAWVVCGAGTGGTSATIGRYLRYRRLRTRLAVAEPRGGAFATGWRSGCCDALATCTSLIEGIARPAVEPGFVFGVVDAVHEIDDAASCAAAWLLEELFGRRYGGSSGTNLVACLEIAEGMRARGEQGSIVTLLADRGERYADTVFDREWLQARGLDIAPWLERWRPCVAPQLAAPPRPAMAAVAVVAPPAFARR
jgi:cysteine synthase